MTVLVDLVIHAEFVVRKRGLTAPAISQNLEALVNQTLVVKLTESPDDTLGVVGVEGLVVVFEVDPARLAGNVCFPIFGVFQNRSAAVLIKFVDAEFFDFRATRNAQLTLCFNFRRQTVGVPAKAALYAITLHRLETGNHVFGVAGEQVAVVRQAIGEWRAVVKHEFLGVGGLALVNRLLESSVLGPESKNFFFDRRKRWAWVYTLARGFRRI